MRRRLSKFLFVFCLSLLLFRCDLFRQGDNAGDENGLIWIDNQNTVADATIYYVSPNGSDDASGTTEQDAFATVAHALMTVHPGGTVRILPGTYTESLGILNCGSPASPITITGHGGTPLFDGQNEKPIALFFEECSNLMIQNLEIKNYTDIGIGATMSNSMTFQNLILNDNGHAVQLTEWELEGYGIHVDFSQSILIQNNDTYENGPDPQVFPDRLMGTGINTFGNTDVVISSNSSHHNIGGGILVEDSENVIVEDNEVYENDLDATVDEWWDGGLWLDGGRNVVVRNNVFRDNLGPGIQISDEDLQNPTGYVLQDNISTRNYYGIYIWNFGTSDWPPETVLQRSGNQFMDNTIQDVWIVDWD